MSCIRIAETEDEVRGCFPVMVQLRTHLDEAAFLEAVNTQKQQGYMLAFLQHGERVRAVAGFRISQCLAWGRFMYVDDLVTDAEARSQGYGAELIDWLLAFAKAKGCSAFHLDSGVQRFGAHRFYLQKGMDITCHHFGMDITAGTG